MEMRSIIDLIRLDERTHRVHGETGEPIMVFETPSPEQLRLLLEAGPVSGLLAPRDRLLIWLTSDASHLDVVAAFALNKIGCIDLDMLPKGPMIHATSAHYRVIAGDHVEQSAIMRRLYGPHFEVLNRNRR